MQTIGKSRGPRAQAETLLRGHLKLLTLLRASMKGAFRPEMNMGQFRILACLAGAEKGASNNQVADLMGVSRSAVSRKVDGMVKAGMISREKGGQDRRQVRLALSPAGRRRLERLKDMMEKELARRIAALEPAARRRLEEGLEPFLKLFS